MKKNSLFENTSVGEVREISPTALSPLLKEALLIDVRRPDEFNAELGHIKGAQLVTLGPDLIAFLKTKSPQENIIFVCRSGGRSGTAVQEGQKLGFMNTLSLKGGMLMWNELNLPVERA